MDRVIRVTQGFYPNEYNSLSEAVSAAAKRKKSKKELINGKVVVNYQFNGNFLILSFDNGKYLTISFKKKSIDWDVVSIKPQIKKEINEQNIYFEFANGSRIFWDWKTILDSFVGNQIAISPSEQYLFIFARGGDEYIFSGLVDKDDFNNKFLFISAA